MEYLILAGRFIGDASIAHYVPIGHNVRSCVVDSILIKGKEIPSSLCLVDGRVCFVILSPHLLEPQVLGYNKLVFDLSAPAHMICMDTAETILFYNDAFQKLISDAKRICSGSNFLFCKQGFYYHTISIQHNLHFVSKQNEDSLLKLVHQISRQTFTVGISVLLAFASLIYCSVIRFAKNKLLNF